MLIKIQVFILLVLKTYSLVNIKLYDIVMLKEPSFKIIYSVFAIFH